MNIKRIITIVFSCGIIFSTCAISAVAGNHLFEVGYRFTEYGMVNNVSEVFAMKCYHQPSKGQIYTQGTNMADISTYMSLGVTVFNKSTGLIITDNANNGVCANDKYREVSCTDYRSKNTNVYYRHDCTIYGDTSGHNSSSMIATRSAIVMN